ncbi:uncharacterized protein LOC110020830 [Phalaenopsis equestris]|uniref:uncharacterized protein LOC110020830 n=1 Tax=Phalaenopsis equestris TaxID=78828 RepID=UPI0009E3761C|nr:uncharacterized protein LOC110020830 [Phalaenopsis equestris]
MFFLLLFSPPIEEGRMMRALDILPSSIPPQFRRQLLYPSPSPPSLFFSYPTKPYSAKSPPSSFPRRSTALRSSINGEKPDESVFFDEDGVIGDMDGYLNHVSLEYDSVWDTKPYWCQPWTIVLTGAIVTLSSWLWLHSVVISIGILCLVSAWWYIFLYAYPKAYSNMIAERRKNVNSGAEDSFGFPNSQ